MSFLGDLGVTLISTGLQHAAQKSQSKKDFERQKEFAQNQVQWRVADAQKAGIHPLAALGLQPTSFSASVGGGADFQSMGQDISRAMMASMDRRERLEAARAAAVRAAAQDERDAATHSANLENTRAHTAFLLSQAARMNSGGQVGPAAPGGVNVVPSRVITGAVGAPAQQPGPVAHHQFQRTPDGGFRIIQSEQGKERNEDSLEGLEWSLANNFVPRVTGSPSSGPPADVQLPRNSHWSFNSLTNTWHIRRGRFSFLGFGAARRRVWERRFGVRLERR